MNSQRGWRLEDAGGMSGGSWWQDSTKVVEVGLEDAGGKSTVEWWRLEDAGGRTVLE